MVSRVPCADRAPPRGRQKRVRGDAATRAWLQRTNLWRRQKVSGRRQSVLELFARLPPQRCRKWICNERRVSKSAKVSRAALGPNQRQDRLPRRQKDSTGRRLTRVADGPPHRIRDKGQQHSDAT